MVTFLEGDVIDLTPLEPSDVTDAYLSWLNDRETLLYRGPKSFPTTMPQLRSWVEGLPSRGDLVLAIRLKGGQHIGNIALNSIQWPHRTAELSMMIGDKTARGKGYSREAISLTTDHAFRSMNLNRIWAESPNPAFNATMKSLGWTEEGRKRAHLFANGKMVDLSCWAIFQNEWQPIRATENSITEKSQSRRM